MDGDGAAWERWAPRYARLVRAFGFDAEADRQAALRLARLVPSAAGWPGLRDRLEGRRVAVVGCGLGLAKLKAKDLKGCAVVAADGAALRLHEIGVAPDAVVTDLDGEPRSLESAVSGGAVAVVHAHGDNLRALEALPRLTALATATAPVGTHQVRPEPGLAHLAGLGGFTDGDRAVLLCERMAAAAVRLVAFDLEGPPGPYSGRFDPRTKPAKLRVAQEIIREVAARGALPVEDGPRSRPL